MAFLAGLESSLLSIEHHARDPLEVGAHSRHETRVGAGSVAWNERCEEGGSHVQGVKIIFVVGVFGVAKDADEDRHHCEEDVVKQRPATVLADRMLGIDIFLTYHIHATSPHGRLFTSFNVSRAAWAQITVDEDAWFKMVMESGCTRPPLARRCM